MRPVCIAKPTFAQDVAVAVRILGFLSLRTPFAIRGSGHNANVGWAGVIDAVTIDIREVKAIELDMNNMVVKVGAGAV